MPTALIVDDEPQANRLLAMLMQIRGYQTVCAFRGADAIRLAHSEQPDVVLLDLMLPDRTGLDVLGELRDDPATSLLPVVVVTARLVQESRAQSLRAGASDYIHKPFTPEQIFEAVETSRSRRQRLLSGQLLQIVLGMADADEFERRLAEVRGLLLARSSLPAPILDGMITNLRRLSDRLAGAQAPGAGVAPATVTVRLATAGLDLTLNDPSGRLAPEGFVQDDSLSDWMPLSPESTGTWTRRVASPTNGAGHTWV